MWAATSCCVLGILLGAATVQAQSEPDAPVDVGSEDAAAREHFERGAAAFQDGRFDEAASEFGQAYDLSGRPELLYNLYVSHRDAGNDVEALRALRAYLDAGAPGGSVPRLEESARVLEERIADEQDDGPPVLAITLLVSGGVLAVAGITTGILSEVARSDLESACTAAGSCPPELEATRDRGQALAIATDVLLASAVVAVGIGVVLLIVGADDDEPEVMAGCSSTGCGVTWRGQL